jgi:predicted acyl esterase
MNPRHRVISSSVYSASIFILQLAVGLVLVSAFAHSAQGAELRLEKTRFAPGETIRVSFTASPDYAANAWVGIIPSNVPHGSEAVNDQHDMTYQYLNKRTSGELMFTAPTQPGSYDFRMNDRDDNGSEVASTTFRVGAGGEPVATGQATLRLGKNMFAPGETIRVSFAASPDFAANAWVGIIPSAVPHGSEPVNDQNDSTYQYLNKRTSGELTFTAPTQPGSYDFRMNDRDDNGVEVASVTFRVGADQVTLRLEKNSFAPGETIRVSFTALPDFAANAWVGIIPSTVPHGSEAVNDQHDITYQYLNKRTSGELAFTAPTQPGSYDFRMNDRDDNGKEVASVSFRVE